MLVLVVVLALNLALSQSYHADWSRPLRLVIYPINADHSAVTQAYLNQLNPADFAELADFLRLESSSYRAAPIKIETYLTPPIEGQPPPFPKFSTVLESVIWSIRMLYWAADYRGFEGVRADVRIFIQYFSPYNTALPEYSLGIQKGRIGLVNGYADPDQKGLNNYVLMHELLHTLGASDKYHPKTLHPYWPDGFSEPYKLPLYPQHSAEIMGGRAMLSEHEALIPPSLRYAVVGEKTAKEIGWLNW